MHPEPTKNATGRRVFGAGAERLWSIAATIGLVLLTCAFPLTSHGDDAPAWLRQAVSAPMPPLAGDVPAVVLLNEQNVKVDPDGKVTTQFRYAVKVLTNEGRGWASRSVHYLTDGDKVRDVRAWTLRPSGQVRKYGKNDILDVAPVGNDVYNESRLRLVSGRDAAEPGAVFAFEATREERSVFTQFDFAFQGEGLPVGLARFTLTLPDGWSAESVTFNRAAIEPSRSGLTHLWELRSLPGIPREAACPPLTRLAPMLAVSYYPPAGRTAGIGKTFRSWQDVYRWLSELTDSRAALDDELAGKARSLVAGASTEFERIQALGRFAQSINYVSIQLGTNRGGGYCPRFATDVLRRSYGDCKDKANLMRAMLKAIGKESYLMPVYSGDPDYVREEWPTPQQFNHCIIAIRVGAETQAASIVEHPQLGRLLIFDPTDDVVPVGELPDHEQGGLGLIVAGAQGGLLRMPVTPPEANMLTRRVEAALLADGSLWGTVTERGRGQTAVELRREFRGQTGAEYASMIERWISLSSAKARVLKVEPSDSGDDGHFDLNVRFEIASYGQLMQDRLLVFKPAIVGRRDRLELNEPLRRHPVVLQPHSYSEEARIKLPVGFEVDELPDPVDLKAPFGSYSTSYEVKDGHLHFKRALQVEKVTLPASDYNRVKKFFEQIQAAENTPAVLIRN